MSRWSSTLKQVPYIEVYYKYNSKHTHTHTHTHTELPVYILNGQLLTECESTVVLHGGDGKKKKSICVCVCSSQGWQNERKCVREREKKTMVEWKKQAGSTVAYAFIRCQHIFIIFCWIRLMESMGVVRAAVGLTADRGTVALFQNL